ARSDDHSGDPMSYDPGPNPPPGVHVVDPLNPGQGFLTPGWGDVTPFGITDWRTQIITPAAPSLTSDEYTDAFNQTKALGEEFSTVRTMDETEIGLFWGYDVAIGLGDPPRLYNQ